MNESAAVVPLKPESALPATWDFTPKNLSEAMEFCRMIAEADIVPKEDKGKPGNLFIKISHGAEVGLKPMQALQSIAVINGKPTLWGDACLALVIASPACEYVREAPLNPDYGECRAKRRGEPERVVRFTREDAQRANLLGKDIWKAYLPRMLQMRARAFALRDVFPDVLKGLPIAEEVRDYVDVTDQGASSVGETSGAAREGELQPAKPASKSDAVKAKLLKQKVLQELAEVGSTEALGAAKAAAIKANLTGDEEVAAAYRAAKERVGVHPEEVQSAAAAAAATDAGVPDEASVLKSIERAQSNDDLDVQQDVTNHFPVGDVRNRLSAAISARREQLGA